MKNYTGAINHIGLSCSDLAKSKEFYGFLLVDLMGYNVSMDEPVCVMFGRKTGEGLHHLAFSAGTHEEIDEFHKKIVDFYESHPGFGHILNAPALYPYVYFTDPDGIKLELVFSSDQ
ncbi:hypothetical protein BG003_003825 [Podila horticola]|nr:hypothetical protein BG003_003825 [Podila horticola]